MSYVKDVEGSSFNEEVINSKQPVLVDFWAPWCGPCQMMIPVLDDVSLIFKDKLKVIKVNVDSKANLTIAQNYHIMSIPNLKIFINGEVVADIIGLRSKADLVEEIESYLK